MHICMTDTTRILEDRGPIGPLIYGLSKELSRDNFVDVFGYGVGKEEASSLRIRALGGKSEIVKFFDQSERLGLGRILALETLLNADFLKNIFHLHSEFPIDILHINALTIPYSGVMASTCKLILNIPFVCSAHNEIRLVSPLRFCDKILAVSNHIKRFLYEEKNIKSSKIDVLPNAIDVHTFKPTKDKEQAKKELGLRHRKVILFVGRKHPEKGPQILIEAIPEIVRQIPEVVVLLIGPDYFFGTSSKTYTMSLMARAKELKVEDHVIFKDFMPRGSLRQYYNAADVFTCPSIREAFGIVILEALAYGKPVVASNVGGIPEIISDGVNGLLVPHDSPKALADAVVHLFENNELAELFGQRGRKLAEERFSYEAIGKRCLNIYEEVLSKC